MTRITCLRLAGPLLFVALTLGRQAVASEPVAGATSPSAASSASRRSATTPLARGEKWSRTELYFGSQVPGGTEVSQEDFDDFLAAEVSPRFPAGLTLLIGRGEYLNSQGLHVQERTLVLILLYPRRASGSSEAIEGIRAAYKRRFRQESVLRVDSIERVSF